MTGAKETEREMWERVRRENICRMVAEEPGTVWARGHTLFTLGAHTGHSVMPIAFCEDEAWAAAIASAIEARSDETAQQAQPGGRERDPKGDAQ